MSWDISGLVCLACGCSELREFARRYCILFGIAEVIKELKEIQEVAMNGTSECRVGRRVRSQGYSAGQYSAPLTQGSIADLFHDRSINEL